MARRSRLIPLLELLSVVALIAMVSISYFIITEQGTPQSLLTPPMVAMLLVANLVPAMALMVLAARRVAVGRAARSQIGGKGRLHVRLVALFSVIASVPTLLVVIFASLLFQSGTQFWFSDRARTVLENADRVAQVYAQENKERIQRDIEAMGGDVIGYVNEYGVDSPLFAEGLFFQVLNRDLTEAAVINVGTRGELNRIAVVNLDDRPLEERFPSEVLSDLRSGDTRVVTDAGDRVEAVVRLDPKAEVYLYASRKVNPAALQQIEEARSAASDYQKTLQTSRTLQFRFNAVLLAVSLLIVAISIWIALTLADRVVRPMGNLIDAARRVTAGDLSARVPRSKVQDEVGILANAFNRMTRNLEEQTGALVSANSQLDSRRAFIEAVLSGVTAGIISVDRDRRVRLINSSAEALLNTGKEPAVGQALAVLAPEFDKQLDAEEREDIIQFSSGGEPRTLAFKRVKVEGGWVLTFDDITEQLLDQRRAAWSDVARRIAHEIKNPLTPIQLAAERLQRRYGREIASDPATFERLTGTIVRQVGDLRRMVDEFSSFARMPKPIFREEDIVELARHAVFLHEVAHPEINFVLDAAEPSLPLVCDRRQLGQALTNIVKNGVEAIQQRREEQGEGGEDRIAVSIAACRESQLCIEISDSGVGLPSERARLTEPYMTTRVKGTGLGLAIVKKIVEEHFGSIEFDDAPGGGTLVRLVFDAETLARLAADDRSYSQDSVVNG
ncbi:PAS domain-containing sensor histidine kinase [Sphingosinicella sp. LY1275]|uniref:sensor histidine kinase n=1 Tax=Sphingosinicella sp. LY1275 TaxID=3095379 RepID=UPI002ADEE9A7|nr:PAS domain-containing sensor histidine kinase [Sphingosinicella sp. LY1275]MEA1013417.1 PAS domain-containing sensor histidine kinase [Sphingosinicella sp. LY1275]